MPLPRSPAVEALRALWRSLTGGGGVRAVCGAKGVVDKDVAAGRQLLGKGGVVLLLLGVPPHVLQQQHLRQGRSTGLTGIESRSVAPL